MSENVFLSLRYSVFTNIYGVICQTCQVAPQVQTSLPVWDSTSKFQGQKWLLWCHIRARLTSPGWPLLVKTSANLKNVGKNAENCAQWIKSVSELLSWEFASSYLIVDERYRIFFSVFFNQFVFILLFFRMNSKNLILLPSYVRHYNSNKHIF